MNYRSLGIASLVGGTFMAVLSRIPIISLGNCLLCGWLWGGGILAVWMYHNQEDSRSYLTSGQGVIIGASAGIVGAIFGSIFYLVIGGTVFSAFSGFSENFGSLAASAAFSVLTFCGNIIVYPIFGAIGGAIGALVFKPPN